MAKKVAYDLKSIKYLEGRAFAPLPLDLLESDAWRGMSVNCWRLVTRLMAEHMAHAGQMNGHLIVSYDQLVEWGIGRRLVAGAIREGEQRGLVRVRRGGKRNQVTDHLSRYTLTFYPILRMPPGENAYHVWPSDEWKRYRDPKLKNRVQVHEGEPGSDHLSTSIGSPSCTEPATEAKVSAVPAQEPSVHEGEHPIISWRDTAEAERPSATTTTGQGGRDPLPPTSERATTTTTTTTPAGRQPAPVEDERDVHPTTDQPEPTSPTRPARNRPTPDDAGVWDIEELIAHQPGKPSPQEALRARATTYLATNPPRGKAGLAERIGLSRPRLSNWLSRRDPNLSRAATVALRLFLDSTEA